jgi:hypothetical protein
MCIIDMLRHSSPPSLPAAAAAVASTRTGTGSSIAIAIIVVVDGEPFGREGRRPRGGGGVHADDRCIELVQTAAAGRGG